MKFNEIKSNEYDKYTFGKCIRARREELGRSVRDLAKAVQMSPIYLSDIERGLRVAPTSNTKGIDYMENLIRELSVKEDESLAFRAMAEVSKGQYIDIQAYLSKTPSARLALRLADEKNIPDEEWQKFIIHLQALKSSTL